MKWQKASNCADHTCVEARDHDDHIDLRDSKDPDGPVLAITRADFSAFVIGVKNGDFDNLISK